MESSVIEYIDRLLRSRGISQSQLARDIFVSRQQVSYFMSGARELSLDLALRLESYFGLREGTLLVIQARARMARCRQDMKQKLFDKLRDLNAFWSYGETTLAQLSDDDIIEATILHLDMDEIEQLFALFGERKVRDVWRTRLACQGERLHDLNIMMAMYYFGIRKPEQYLLRLEREYFKKIAAYA